MNTLTQYAVKFLTAQSLHLLILFALVLAATMAMRHKSAHLRYLLWLVIVAKCLVPPLHTISVAILPASTPTEVRVSSQAPALQTVTAIATDPQQTHIESFSPTPQPSEPAIPQTRPAPIATAEPTLWERLALVSSEKWIPVVWLSGIVLFCLVIAGKAIRFHLYLREHRTDLTQETHPAIFGFLSAALPDKKPLRVYQLSRPGQPFVWGLPRGAVYLPENFTVVNDPHKQQSILMHEAGHILRMDPLVNFLQVIAQGVFWFHPLVWIANRMIRTEREKCCDEFAVATLKTAPRHYCTAIVEALMTAQPVHPAIPTLAVAGPVKNIEDRIKTLLTPGKIFRRRPTVLALIVITLLAAIIVPTTIALTHKVTPPDYTLSGSVVAADGKAIAGAIVFDDGYGPEPYQKGITDAAGKFKYKSWNEEHNITAKADDYTPQTITFTTWPFDNSKQLNFKLQRATEAHPVTLPEGVTEVMLLPEHLESQTVLSLKTGQFILTKQANEAKEPFLCYSFALSSGENFRKFTAASIPENRIGVNAGNLDTGGGGFGNEGRSLWAIQKIQELPDFRMSRNTREASEDIWSTDGVFIHPPLDGHWPYIAAFKGDDGTYGVFEITSVKDRKIHIRFKTLNQPQPTQSSDLKIQTDTAVNLVPLSISVPRWGSIDFVPHSQIPNLEQYPAKPRPAFMVPKGTVNVALNKTVTSSARDIRIGKLSMVTDGIKAEKSMVELEGEGLQWITIDLESEYDLHAIVLWHCSAMYPVYYDVIIQVSDDSDFKTHIITLFNNDHDNSAGMGIGSDKNYIEMPEGKLIDARGKTARYVRLYTNGSAIHPYNHYVEVEVYAIPDTTIKTHATDGDPASSQTHPSDLKTQNYIASLPNGTTVELLGVCEHPSKDKQWFKPDGVYLDSLPNQFDAKYGSTGYYDRFTERLIQARFKCSWVLANTTKLIFEKNKDRVISSHIHNISGENGDYVTLLIAVSKKLETTDLALGIQKKGEGNSPVEWLTFKNVSLRPGVKTEVEIVSEKPEVRSQQTEGNSENAELRTQNTAFTAVLPNGVTVELLGICEHPSEGQQWWRPDGQITQKIPYAKFGWSSSWTQTGREFAVRVMNAENCSVASKSDRYNDDQWVDQRSPLNAEGKPVANLKAFLGVFETDQYQGDVSFGVACGPWEKVEEWRQIDWTVEHADKISFTSRKSVIFTGPQEYMDGFIVSVTHTFEDKAARLVLVDKKGQHHVQKHSREGEGQNLLKNSYYVQGIKRSNIDKFIFETRDYEWVTFKNVALRPDMKTGVEVVIGEGSSTKITGKETGRQTVEELSPLSIPAGAGRRVSDALHTLIQTMSDIESQWNSKDNLTALADLFDRINEACDDLQGKNGTEIPDVPEWGQLPSRLVDILEQLHKIEETAEGCRSLAAANQKEFLEQHWQTLKDHYNILCLFLKPKQQILTEG